MQDSWNSGVTEAESLLSERPKMASGVSPYTYDDFQYSFAQEGDNKARSSFSLSTSEAAVEPEASQALNGTLSSSLPTLEKPSTLQKPDEKKKQNNLTKDLNSKESKKMFTCSPDGSDRDNEECPYSDLDSIPILCSKALERQPKAVSNQTSASSVKEVRKQPENQSGLWFSKSGKERRQKTSTSVPDRTLFSKASCKKKNQAIAPKKVVTSVSGSVVSEKPGLSDRTKPLINPEANWLPEQSEHWRNKNSDSCHSDCTTGGVEIQSSLSEKHKSLVTEETDVFSTKYTQQTPKNTADSPVGKLSDQFGGLHVKNTQESDGEVGDGDYVNCLENAKSSTQSPDKEINNEVSVVCKILNQPEKTGNNKTPASRLNSANNSHTKKSVHPSRTPDVITTNIVSATEKICKKTEEKENNKTPVSSSNAAASIKSVFPTETPDNISAQKRKIESNETHVSSLNPTAIDNNRCSKSVKSVSPPPDKKTNNQVNAAAKISSRKEKMENLKTPESSINSISSADQSLIIQEKQASLLSKCRQPFVKLIRRDLMDTKVLNSRENSIDQSERKTNEKPSDSKTNKIKPQQSEKLDVKANVSLEKILISESLQVSVVKLKTAGENCTFNLPSPQGKHTSSSNVAGVSPAKVVNSETENCPKSVTCSSVNQSNQSDNKDIHSEQSEVLTKKPSTDTSTSNISSPASQNQSRCLEGTKEKAKETSEDKNDETIPVATVVIPQGQTDHEKQSGSESMNDDISEVQIPENSETVVQTQSKQVLSEVYQVQELPTHLPASTRLLTRALKAMQEKKEKDQKRMKQKEEFDVFRKAEDYVFHSHNFTRSMKTKQISNAKLKHYKSKLGVNSELNQDTHSSCCSLTVMSSGSADFEADVKREEEDHSVSSTPPMDFIPLTSTVKAKKDDLSVNKCSSSSSSSPFSFMNDFKNVKEITLQSVTNERNGQPISFKPHPNYEFSTFLMMLKDLHDTREREGAPLELNIGPPSAHVKGEPLVVPGQVTPAQQEQNCNLFNSTSSQDKMLTTPTKDSKCQTLKRFHNRRSGCTGWKRRAKHKVPCDLVRSGPGFPGLESTRAASLPIPDCLLGVNYSSQVLSLKDMQVSCWEKETRDGKEVVERETEEERWRRVKGNLQNMVPLEKHGFNTMLHQEDQNAVVDDHTETNETLTRISAGCNKVSSGRFSSFFFCHLMPNTILVVVTTPQCSSIRC